MPKRKNNKKVVVKKSESERKETRGTSFANRFGLEESYASLFLGVIVVVIVAVVLLLVVSGRNTLKKIDFAKIQTQLQQQVNKMTNKPTPSPTPTAMENSYTVKSGDSLWNIAENRYKSGDKWVEIAQANNLSNPDIIFAGNKLTLPDLENAPKGKTYTVKEGDSLWSISVNTYADGYKWTEIAKANNLSNPDWIYAGEVLQLP